MPTRSPEARRISSLLSERRVSSTAMAAVLSLALLFGLFGFAFQTLSIDAILVLALGSWFCRSERPPGSQRRRRSSLEGRTALRRAVARSHGRLDRR